MSSMKNKPNASGQQDTSRKVQGMQGTQGPGETQSHSHMNGSEMENCGSARRVADIEPHMDVIASCGCNMGKVDHMEDNAIKLTRNDSPDGQHHFIPKSWVARVDEHVHLNKNAEETQQEWKSEAAGCAACGS